MTALERLLVTEAFDVALLPRGWERAGRRTTWTRPAGSVLAAMTWGALRGNLRLEWGFYNEAVAVALHERVPKNAEVGWGAMTGTASGICWPGGTPVSREELNSEDAVRQIIPRVRQDALAVAEFLEAVPSASALAEYLLAWDFDDGAGRRQPFVFPGGRALGALIAAGLLAIDGDPRAAKAFNEAEVVMQLHGGNDPRVERMRGLVRRVA